MQTNVIDIIIYLVRQLQIGQELKDVNTDKLQEYDNAEISAAYSWVLQKYKAGDIKVESTRNKNTEENSHRVLHIAERMMITPAAHGYLLELLNMGLIDHLQMEQIIEKVMLHPTERVTLEKIKNVASNMIFSDSTTPMMSFLLKGNERIN